MIRINIARLVVFLLTFNAMMLFATDANNKNSTKDNTTQNLSCIKYDKNIEIIKAKLNEEQIDVLSKVVNIIKSHKDVLSQISLFRPNIDTLYYYKLFVLLRLPEFNEQYGVWSDSMKTECMKIYDEEFNISLDSTMIFNDPNFKQQSNILVENVKIIISEFDKIISNNNNNVAGLSLSSVGNVIVNINKINREKKMESSQFYEDFISITGLTPVDKNCISESENGIVVKIIDYNTYLHTYVVSTVNSKSYIIISVVFGK